MQFSADLVASLGPLLQGLMSPDNQIRSKAEKTLDQEWRSPEKIGVFLAYLASTAAGGADDSVKAFSAVLFRRQAIRSPKEFNSISERTIGVLEEPVRHEIRTILLQGFVSDQSPQVRRKIADAVSEVAKEDASPKGTWPELVPAILQAAVNPNASFRESAFRILSTLPELIESLFVAEILPVFNNGFSDDDDEVRIAACTAFVAFFRELPKSIWQSLTPILPNLLNSLPRFLLNGQDEALANVLQSLIDLVELAPKMFKDMFPTIIDFCSTVAKNRDLASTTRLAALELLTTFSEVSPTMCKQTPSYTSTMVLITLSMLTEVSEDDDDAAEWNNDTNDEDYELEPEYDSARHSLDRVSLKLGGQYLAAPLFQYLPALIQLPNWRETFAALMALSSAAEGCADVLVTEIPKLLDMVMPTLEHPHPRVQYACCNVLGQISTDFADDIQRTAGDRIVPALVSKLTNKSVPRVQAHGAAALVNFCEAATKEVLEPYLDDLLNNLVGLLLSPKRYVQEQALTTIATIADAAEKKFIKYHNTLLPMLMDFLRTDLGPENQMLTAKCVECATLIASAVGRDNLGPHCQELINIMGRLQETADDDGPVKPYLELGWSRICRIIGKDFVPYLPIVLPPLLTAAKAAQDISLLEEDEAQDFANNEEWDIISLSGKLIAVHTASLDEKSSALDLLRIYATQLGGAFQPYVQEILQDIALPALDFYLHDGVRGSAALSLGALLKCTIAVSSWNSPDALAVWNLICLRLTEAVTQDPVPELIVAYYTTIVECTNLLAPGSLTKDQMHQLAVAIEDNLSGIYSRIKKREHDDDEYREEIDESEDEYTDEELLDEINKAITAIFTNAKATFIEEYNSSLAELVSTFISDDIADIKLCGLSIICDVMEHCGSALDQGNFLTYIISNCLTAPQASIRQASAYAIGMAAQNGENLYMKLCIEALMPLFKVATFPDARAEENINSTENCVLAIAKICQSFGSSIPNLDEVLKQWIILLPVLQDAEAASTTYAFLATLIDNKHPVLGGHEPKVVDAIIHAINEHAVTGSQAEHAARAARELLQLMPQDKAMAVLQPYANLEAVSRYFS
ncbi:hypothetical protein PUMCH_003595 [Australozyma saopauloensis]|uniref:Importin N-terminal domain-containing protein n=1 Tax=Australozyma saopauloensis TaxID=291208 RepID=A0AAX4HCI3_9ASCO|nr:hypothetical protein PUMCH_003595 [[Candida] saopauloensis]